MRRPLLLTLAAGLLLLAGGAAYLLPRWLDWDRHRLALAEIASERLGRPVALEGRVALVLLPQPRLEASRLAIGQAADEIQMSARALRLRLDLWALLLGRIEVRELALVGAEIRLPWPPTALPGLTPPPWLTALDARLEESRIQIGGAVLEGVNARLRAGAIGEALTAEGSLAWRGRPMQFQAVLGRAGDGGVAPLDITAAASGASLRARGVLLTEGGFAGRLEAAGPDLAALIPAPAGAFRATANLAAGAELLVANQLELTLGADAVRGGAMLRLVPEPRFELTLTAPRLDLEPWLAALRGAGAQAVPVALDLSAEAASFGPLQLGDLRATATLQQERLTLGRVTATMPGGTALELSGGGGSARLELGLRWNSARPAEWLGALGQRLVLPPGSSDGHLRLSWESGAFAVTEMQARLGATRATGGFVWRPGGVGIPRANLALGLEFDTLELAQTPAQLAGLLREAAGGADLQLRLGFGRLLLGGELWERLALDGALEGGRLVVRRLAGRHLGLDMVLAGTLSALGPGARLSDMTLEAEGPVGPLLSRLGLARPDLATSPLRLRVAGGGPLEALALRVEGDIAEARLEAQVTLDLPQERFQSRLTARHPGAVRLLGQALARPPPDWIGEGSFSLIAHLAGRPGAWNAESFEIVAGELRGRGQGAWAAGSDRPALSGRLALERLPLPGGFDPGAWPAADLDLAITAERLLPRGLPVLEGFSARLRADAASLRVKEMRASLAGGNLAGGLRWEAGTLRLEGSFADVVLAAPLTGRPVDIAAGRISGALRLEASGAAPRDWLRSASGEGSLGLRDGVVQGFDAPAAAAALGWADGEAALRLALAGGATPVERGTARFTLRQGVLTLEEATLGAEAGLVLGLTLRLDLPEDRLALRLTLPVPEGAPPVALELDGPSMNPVRRADVAPWVEWRAINPP